MHGLLLVDFEANMLGNLRKTFIFDIFKQSIYL